MKNVASKINLAFLGVRSKLSPLWSLFVVIVNLFITFSNFSLATHAIRIRCYKPCIFASPSEKKCWSTKPKTKKEKRLCYRAWQTCFIRLPLKRKKLEPSHPKNSSLDCARKKWILIITCNKMLTSSSIFSSITSTKS